MRKEDFDAVKRLPIIQFLAAVNVVPARIRGAEHAYRSPIRDGDSEPSFFVNKYKNSWYDFGAGVGGNIIDLAMRLFSTNYATAGQMLLQIMSNPHLLQAADAAVVEYERNQAAAAADATTKLAIERVGALNYGVLKNYLISRKINLGLLERDGRLWGKLREVWYTQPGKSRKYFAIGFVNDSGGMELRAPGFQSCTGTKDVTYLKGRVPGVAIFEGFMDYFAAITVRKKAYQCSVLILNSVSLAKKSLHLVQNEPIIYSYLDNDQKGLETLAFYRSQCKDSVFECQNEVYRGYKDVNDWLMKKKPEKPLPIRGDGPSVKSRTARWWLWVVFENAHEQGIIDMVQNSKGKWVAKKRRESTRECTFYSYNNHEDGYNALIALRHALQDKVKISRLCERTTGRKFTYEQLHHFLPQERQETSKRRHPAGLTSPYEKLLYSVPSQRALA